METELVPYQKINSLAKRIEKANLKRLHTSPTWGTIANKVNSLILEVRSDPCVVLIRNDWREIMKQRGTL